ncbi:hypothetical protein ACTHQ7_07245 [Microbacterium enclense]
MTEAGEPPILPDGLNVLLRRRWEFQHESGLDEGHIHSDPLIAFPLPVYSRERWSGLTSMMWCPLAWLPAPLSGPRGGVPLTPTAATRVWAASTVLALGMSGMYSPDLGFEDISHTFGFDVGDPSTAHRLMLWQAGGSDHLFDEVAASVRNRLLSESNPAAAASLLKLLPLQQQVIADSLSASLKASKNTVVALPGYLTVAMDLLGDYRAVDPYQVGDILLGMIAEVTGPPGSRVTGSEADEVAAEALLDFQQSLEQIAAGIPVGAA